MNNIFTMLAEDGVPLEDLRVACSEIIIAPELVSALKSAKENGAKIVICSDANTFFIQEILNANDLNVVDLILTNPSSVVSTENGAPKLQVTPFVEAYGAHYCPVCPYNLCKTAALINHADLQPKTRTIYAGDGGNDACPCTRYLTSGDVALARTGLSLARTLQQNPPQEGVQVVEWKTGADLAAAITNALTATFPNSH